MYLAIGSSAVLKKSHIIGIFDLDNTTVSRRTRPLLSAMQARGEVQDACEPGALPKSMILCEHAGRRTLWLSQYAPQTLARRTELTRAPAVIKAFGPEAKQNARKRFAQ